MELIRSLYREEDKYLEYVKARREQLKKLKDDPNIPKSERFKESDPIYDEYNELYVTESVYYDAIDAWLYENVYNYWDKSDDILTEADIRYDSFIEDFELTFA